MLAATPLTHGQRLRALSLPGFRLLETRHAQGLSIPRHAHAHACLNFVLEGCYQEELGSRDGAFAPLTCFFKPAGAVHSNDFRHAGARCLLVELGSEAALAPGTGLTDPVTTRFPSAVRAGLALWHELAAPDSSTALAVEDLALELYEEALSTRHVTREASARVRAAGATLHDDPRAGWTLSSLARHVGLHPSHLARAFRAQHGCTLGEYQRRLRLNEVARALALGRRPIAELMLEQGFADQSHGTRAFRRQFGTTPGAFRRAFGGRARATQAWF